MKKFCALLLVCVFLFAAAGLAEETYDAYGEEMLLTVTIGGVDYRLGTDTVDDLVSAGWEYEVETDGTYGFYSPENESYFYVLTSEGSPSDPIVYIDLMWADGVPVIYCGFEADEEISVENGISLWDWLIGTFQAEMNEDGTLIACCPLQDGSIVQIETKDTRVRLSLLPPA